MGGAKVDAWDERQLPWKIGRGTVRPSPSPPLPPPSKASTVCFHSGPPYSVSFLCDAVSQRGDRGMQSGYL